MTFDPNLLAFDPGELLYRTISEVKRGAVKASSLKAQFSVYRASLVPDLQRVPVHGKFNGVAQITVSQVRALRQTHLTAHCVWEPTKDSEAHSLIALCTDAPAGTDLLVDFEQMRAAIAAAMTIARQPT